MSFHHCPQPHTLRGFNGVTHVPQVWRFQTAQVQLLLDLHRDRAQRAQAELEKAREDLRERTR